MPVFHRKPKPSKVDIDRRTREAEEATAISQHQLEVTAEKHNYISDLMARLAQLNIENGFSEKMRQAYGQR